MAIRSITHNVFSVGSIDWDRRLFDELIPLPDGTSYNAYYIKGSEKTALLDTVDPTKTHELIANLNACNVTNLDYVTHLTQNHVFKEANIAHCVIASVLAKQSLLNSATKTLPLRR